MSVWRYVRELFTVFIRIRCRFGKMWNPAFGWGYFLLGWSQIYYTYRTFCVRANRCPGFHSTGAKNQDGKYKQASKEFLTFLYEFSDALFYLFFGPVLRIRDVYTGSRIRIFPFQIPDLNPHQRIKVFSTVKTKNWIWDVHPGSRVWISSISDPDPRCRGQKAPDRGSGSATLLMTMSIVGIVSISDPEYISNQLFYCVLPV